MGRSHFTDDIPATAGCIGCRRERRERSDRNHCRKRMVSFLLWHRLWTAHFACGRWFRIAESTEPSHVALHNNIFATTSTFLSGQWIRRIPRNIRLAQILSGHSGGRERTRALLSGHSVGRERTRALLSGHSVGRERTRALFSGHSGGRERTGANEKSGTMERTKRWYRKIQAMSKR
jgi:hypothetical protein